MTAATGLKTVLNVGAASFPLTEEEGWPPDEWQVVSFDLDPDQKPDIVGDIRDLSRYDDEVFDGIHASEVLEHIEEVSLGRVLGGFNRILKPRGG
jgi:predicted SAM-dependent methyltransferase